MTGDGTETGAVGPVILLEVEPDTAEWGEKNDKWQSDLADLRKRLERELPGEVAPAAPAEGHMGVETAEVLIALGSSGAFTAAVEVFRTWLQERPARRKLVARWKVEGEEGEIVLDGDNVKSNDLTAIVQEKFKSG